MIETILATTLAICLVLSCAGWSWSNWKQSSQILQQAQAVQVFSRLNDEINARVQSRIKIVNTTNIPNISDLRLGQGTMVNAGADSVSMDQPPISQTALLDDAHEIMREMQRKVNPDLDYTKRDNFADYEEI